MFRYDAGAVRRAPRAKFLDALSAEGVPCLRGYGAMNRDEYVPGWPEQAIPNLYGEKPLKDVARRSTKACPGTTACEQAVWFTQTMLLADRDQHGPDRRGDPQDPEHAADLAQGLSVHKQTDDH